MTDKHITEALKILINQRRKYPELKNKKHILLKFLFEEQEDKKWYLRIGDYKFVEEKKANKIEETGNF